MMDEGENVEIPLSDLGMFGAVLGEQRIEQLREALKEMIRTVELPASNQIHAIGKAQAVLAACTERDENRPLADTQPQCGHPVQAIRSGRDKGTRTSNWCGWCADVETWKRNLEDAQADAIANAEEVERVKAREAQLQEALEPFAKMGEIGCAKIHPTANVWESYSTSGDARLVAGDFHRAVAAIREAE